MTLLHGRSNVIAGFVALERKLIRALRESIELEGGGAQEAEVCRRRYSCLEPHHASSAKRVRAVLRQEAVCCRLIMLGFAAHDWATATRYSRCPAYLRSIDAVSDHTHACMLSLQLARHAHVWRGRAGAAQS